MNNNTQEIISLYDGTRSSVEVANIVGLSPRYVRKVAYLHNLDRLDCGAQPGQKNHRFVSGRRIDLDGYVLVTAPDNHPSARKRKNRENWTIFEHRLVMERKLGRYLLPGEVVDHIDELTLHNDPSNLRLFDKNGDHLHETILGKKKQISQSGLQNIRLKHLLGSDLQPVDTYYLRRKRGDVRLMQILRAMLKLGKDSPYLLGTHRYLMQIGIGEFSHSTIELVLNDLLKRFAADLDL